MYSRSEAILLQRQKSVRLFAPIRGPTCGMEENHMRKVSLRIIAKPSQKLKKSNTCVRLSLRNMINTGKWKMLKCRICCTVLQKYNIRTNFYERFAIMIDENLTHAVFFHAACWHSYGPKQAHTVLTLQKRRFWARIHMICLHARVRKHFRKKCKKTRSGVPSERRTLGQDQKMRRCVFCLTLQKKATPEREHIWYPYTRGSENPSKKNVNFLERGPGGEPLPAAWALKIDGFWKDFCRKEGSIGRVAGTA